MSRKPEKFKNPGPQEAAREFMAFLETKLDPVTVPISNGAPGNPHIEISTLTKDDSYRTFLEKYLKYDEITDRLTVMELEAGEARNPLLKAAAKQAGEEFNDIVSGMYKGFDRTHPSVQRMLQVIGRMDKHRTLPKAMGIIEKTAQGAPVSRADKNILHMAADFLQSSQEVSEQNIAFWSSSEGRKRIIALTRSGILRTGLPSDKVHEVYDRAVSGDEEMLRALTEGVKDRVFGGTDRMRENAKFAHLVQKDETLIRLIRAARDKLNPVLKSLNIPIEPDAPGRG